MAKSKRRAAKNVRAKAGDASNEVPSQPFLEAQRSNDGRGTLASASRRSRAPADDAVTRLAAAGSRSATRIARISEAAARVDPDAAVPFARLPEEIRKTIEAQRPRTRTFHGSKFSLAYFPGAVVRSPCADKFGYMSSALIRVATKLPFNATTQSLLDQLGALMADPNRDTNADSPIPSGFTYMGQFVDHDITLDVSSSLEIETDANTVHNMRTPSLDLDSVYGRGPALDPFLYAFPTSGNASAIKLQLGTNRNTGPGGPAGTGTPPGSGSAGDMRVQTDWDVPRMLATPNTAVIGDPRNDENLIVVQVHHAMLRFHNAVVDSLVAGGFTGDVFVEAKRRVTHHYQWAVVHDFLARICGEPAVTQALATISAPIGSAFRMPVEFAVAAYRFGHSMVRNEYWVNFNFPQATMAQVFEFNRTPRLPVFSNWVVDLNAFFETGVRVPVFNFARKIDSVLAHELETLPGFNGLMAMLAARNLRRGLALGLPSGQGMARTFGITPLTAAQLVQGLPADEVAVLEAQSRLLLTKTPLWYYVLREAMVLEGGDRLGPVGARIVAETFARILKRDPDSYVNAKGGFTPTLQRTGASTFTFADLLIFAGVTEP